MNNFALQKSLFPFKRILIQGREHEAKREKLQTEFKDTAKSEMEMFHFDESSSKGFSCSSLLFGFGKIDKILQSLKTRPKIREFLPMQQLENVHATYQEMEVKREKWSEEGW